MAGRLDVSVDEMHLWLAFCDEIDDAALHVRCRR
jgi:hypothetical protein